MKLRRLAVIATVAAVLAMPASRAEEPAPEVAWWTQSQLAGVPIGTATLVSPGGAQVAASAAAPISVAAVRFPADASAEHELVLQVDLLSTPETANVVACPTTSAWEVTSAGELADAPTWDCSLGQTGGAYDPAARLLRWTLEPKFVRDGQIAVALLPTAGAAAFTMNLTPPTEGMVRANPTADGDDGTSVPPPSSTTTAPASAPQAPSGSGSVDLSDGAVVPGEGFSVDSGPSGLSSPLPTVAPVADETAAVPITDRTAPESGLARALALAVLVSAAAGAVTLWRSGTNRGSERGVGRFRHARTDPPTAI